MFFHMNLTVLLYCIYALTFVGFKQDIFLTILILYWYFVLCFCISCTNKDYITPHHTSHRAAPHCTLLHITSHLYVLLRYVSLALS